MKFIAFLILSFLSIQVYSQDEFLIGKWKFHGITNFEKLDSTSKALSMKFMKDFTLILNASHHYKLDLIRSEIGSWSFNQNSSEIELKSNKGTIATYKIQVDSSEKLIFNLGSTSLNQPILIKSELGEMDNFQIELNTVNNTNAKIDQVAKKWYLQSTEKPNRDPKIAELITQLVKDAYIDLSIKNEFSSKIGNIESKGIWRFDEKNQTIIYGDSEKFSLFWKIKNITDNSLDLIKGNSQEIWHYSTEP